MIGIERLAFADGAVSLQADFDDDGVIGDSDIAFLYGRYIQGRRYGTEDPAADLDGDSVVGLSDLTLITMLLGAVDGDIL